MKDIKDLARTGALGSGAVCVGLGAFEALAEPVAWPGQSTLCAAAPQMTVDPTADALELLVEPTAYVLDESFAWQVCVAGEEDPISGRADAGLRSDQRPRAGELRRPIRLRAPDPARANRQAASSRPSPRTASA